MSERTKAASRARLILVVAGLFLPTLSLIPLGGLYLWSHGWLLWWAFLAFLTIATVFVVQHRLLRDPKQFSAGEQPGPGIDAPPDVLWSPSEERAWEDVKAIAARIDIDKLDDLQAFADLAHLTVNAVASRLHPEKADALWQFTIPEALIITETVSNRLRGYIISSIPFGDRLTVSQFLTVYRWRHVADLAERAYDVWRLIRLANPATAVTHEARERLSKAMLQWGRAHVLRGLAETFVEEVGRAAIDLYGGRLKLRLLTPLETVEEVPQPLDQKPLVILVAGGTPIERAEALALIEACRVAEPLRSGLEPRISAVERRTPKALEALIAEAREADILLMLATNADAVVALAGIGNFFRAAHALVEPALILASISRGDEPGLAADMVEAAVNAYSGKVIAELEIQLPPAEDDYGPASPLGQALQRAAPHARRVQILRDLDARKRSSDWVRSGRQAVSAAGSMAATVLSKLPLKLRWK